MKNLSRRLVVALALTRLAGCTSVSDDRASTQHAIAYGTADTKHDAVVGLIIPTDDGIAACSGTIVQINGNYGYVLTAAHCCNEGAPSIVVRDTDYGAYMQYVGGNPQPPAYAVAANTVYWDTAYNGNDHDFCMLKFEGAMGAPTIPIAKGNDGLAIATTIEHVGYGVTDTSTDNTQRRTGNSVVNDLTTDIIQWAQGGATHKPGTCQGDSGGPALTPASGAQATQTVVGVTSWGNSETCSVSTIGVASRVTSESGSVGFITKFLADAPTGTKAVGPAAPNCGDCTNTASVTSCATKIDACTNNSKCNALINCENNCTTQACYTQCETTAGTAATALLNAFFQCVCESPACESLCQCPTDPSTVDMAKPKDMAKPQDSASSEEPDLLPPDPEEDEPDLAMGGKTSQRRGGCSTTGGGDVGVLGVFVLAALVVVRVRRLVPARQRLRVR